MGNPFYGAIGASKAGPKSQRGGGKRGIGSAHLYKGIGLNIVSAMNDPRWRKYFLLQIGLIGGAVPIIGPFINRVFTAMANNPKINFGEVMGEIFKVGVGQFFKMMATDILSGALPPGISPILKNTLMFATGIGASTLGSGGADKLLEGLGEAQRIVEKSKSRTIKEIERGE